jgi:transposase InsO family protein
MNSITQQNFQYFKYVDGIAKSIDLWISAYICLSVFSVPEKTLRNGTQLFRKGKIKHWVNYADHETVWIKYNSIPKNTILRQKLPTDSQKALEFLRSLNYTQEETFKSHQYKILESDLQYYYDEKFPRYIKYYLPRFDSNDKRILYAKTHALFERIIYHWKIGASPSEAIFIAFKNIVFNELTLCRTIIFKTHNERSFWRKIKDAYQYGIENAIVHGLQSVPRPDKVKMDPKVEAYIRVLLRHKQNYTYPVILKKVKRKLLVDISLSAVKKFAARKDVQNLTKYYSNGTLSSRANSLPKLSRVLANSPCDIFQGDYYKLQFIIRDSLGNIKTMTAFIVMDMFSRKIVGWALDIKADENTALKAFKMAFTTTGFLPNEIWLDNDLRYKTVRFQHFILATQSIGVTWNFGRPHLPTSRAEIESFFSKFQKKYCSELKFYQGEGLGSRNSRGNPSIELVNEYYSKKHQLPTSHELAIEFASLINQYNNDTDNEDEATDDETATTLIVQNEQA